MNADGHKHDGRTRHVSVVIIVSVGSAFIVAYVLLAFLLSRFVPLAQFTAQISPPSVADTVPTTEPEEATTAALIVLTGAKSPQRDPGAYGSYHVAYSVNESYPASNAIQQVSSGLKALGWKQLQDDWLNPRTPSSHVIGWYDFVTRTVPPERERIHTWGAQWLDKSGNIVVYNFTYSYPESGPQDLQTLRVNASWYPAAGVKHMQAVTRGATAQ